MKFIIKLAIILLFAIIISLIFYYIIIPMYLDNYNYMIDNLLNSNKIKSIEESHQEWLNEPLYKFYINSSHNTYLASYQNLSMTNYDAIKNALLMGAKCIELDVHYKDNKLIVAHGNFDIITTNSLDFDKCLDVINEFGFNNSDPLIIFMELFVNDEGWQLVRNTINEKFKDRLLDSKYKYVNSVTNELMKNLLNKVIIVVTTGRSKFNDINDNNFNWIANKEEDTGYKKESIEMLRIYPKEGINQTLSINYNPDQYWKDKTNMVSLNFQRTDANLYKNLNKFAKSSYILIDS